MGLMTEIINQNDMNGGGNEAAMGVRESVVNEGGRLFDEGYEHYHQLGTMLESDDEKAKFEAGLTLMMVDRTKNLIEKSNEMFGEALTTQSLGQLPNRVLDIVRIFYPNQVATELLDIQPIDGKVGQIFILKPRFSNTYDNITAGDEIFKTLPTYHNYASEEHVEVMGVGDTVATVFAFVATVLPVRPGTVKVETVTGGLPDVAVDDGNGNIVGTNITVGTINYTTGAISVTYTAPPDAGNILLTFCYDSEVNDQAIRSVEFDMDVTPVEAKIHPITFKYSVVSALTAQSHLAIDVQDTTSNLSAQYIKIERDNKVVDLINQNATANATLNFDALAAPGYSKTAKYAEIELKLDAAESIIQTTNGRGGVDWVLCGVNAANIMRNVRGFQAANNVAPVGAHVIGTLRDGTVTVVKSLNLDANTMIFGYKGYMAGDSAMILAEWVPVYFTPVFQAPRFNNEQGVMSMYDLFVNNAGYYVKGTVSNYSA